MISDHLLKFFRQTLADSKRIDADESQILYGVYYLRNALTTVGSGDDRDHTVVSLDQFMKNVEGAQNEFFETLRRAADSPESPLNREALEALVFHSMCLCFRVNQFMNITQVHSGLSLQRLFWCRRTKVSSRAFQNRQLTKCRPAIEDSWNADFVHLRSLDGPLDDLIQHISDQLDEVFYQPRYCPVFQSFGMGKSRLLDEFAKHFFVIPINLRPANTRGLYYSC
jgi:hypothetical protein